MCLIVFAYNAHPDYRLILAANRDEFYARPTAPASWWEDQQEILGGRDLEAGGTWMGMHKNGRFAAVTNYRDLKNIRQDARSRGELPTDFLLSSKTAKEYIRSVDDRERKYNGFNLIVLDQELGYVSNYEEGSRLLNEGVYGLSNALLDTPWTKVEKAKQAFRHIIEQEFSVEDLLEMMQDGELAADEELPETGLDLYLEKALSAMCIRTPDYGTCCTTAITIDYQGRVNFSERSYAVGDRKDQVASFSFRTPSR